MSDDRAILFLIPDFRGRYGLPIVAKLYLSESDYKTKNAVMDGIGGSEWIKKELCELVRLPMKAIPIQHNLTPHNGFSERNPTLNSLIPLWHFHRLKYGHMHPTCWSNFSGGLEHLITQYHGAIPVMPVYLNFADWTSSLEESPFLENPLVTTINQNLRVPQNSSLPLSVLQSEFQIRKYEEFDQQDRLAYLAWKQTHPDLPYKCPKDLVEKYGFKSPREQ